MIFLSLTSRNFKEIYRDPVILLLGLAMPLGLLILFSSIPAEMFSAQSLTPGMIVFSFAFLLMFIAGLLAKDKQTAFLIRLFTNPLKPFDYIVSYLLPLIPFAVAQSVVCLLVGTILGAEFTNFLPALFIQLLTALSCISLGLIIGSLFTLNQVSAIGSLLVTGIALFSGAWMDLKMIGGIFESIGYALPFAHSVDIIRGLLNGKSLSDFINSFVIIVIYTIVLLTFAIISFRQTMKKV